MTFHLEGVDELRAGIEKMVVEAGLASKDIVSTGAHLVEAKTKANFQGTHAKGQPHEGGSFPNVVTGNLRRSITVFGPNTTGLTGWTATVGPTAVYARAIELGLWQNPAVKYPYFTPGFTEASKDFGSIADSRWAAAVGR